MAQGEKPTHYVALKNKEDVKNKVAKPRMIFIGDAWEGQYGYRISFREERTRDDGTKTVGIAAIKLTDGTIIKTSEWHVNMDRKRDATNAATQTQTKFTQQETQWSGDDDSIPF